MFTSFFVYLRSFGVKLVHPQGGSLNQVLDLESKIYQDHFNTQQ